MLVLVSFALVLVATVLLVLGLMSGDGLTLIYISIACSAAAGLVLLVAVRLSRPKVAAVAAGPAPLTDTAAETPAPVEERELVTVGAATLPAAPVVAPAEEAASAADVDTLDTDEDATEAPAADDDWDGEFPIAEYDDLKVNEIMPLLPELYPEELDIVEDRERSTKNRATIISRIQELREGGDGTEAADEESAAATEWAADDEGWEDDGALPISGYDTMSVADLKPRLADLDPDELETVRAHEMGTSNRATVLREIERLLSPNGAAAAARPKKATAAKKAAAAKKATAAKKAGAAKKTAAKKAASRSTKKSATKKKAAGAKKTAKTAKKTAKRSTKKS